MGSMSELHHAYILHYRRYRDTSLILDLFSLEFGKYSAVARGAHGPRSRLRGLLQPFVPLLIATVGKGELRTVSKVDVLSPPIALRGDSLLVGLYVNELLNRLLGRYDPMENLFAEYEELLPLVGAAGDVEPLLRRFEFALLAQLGYGIELNVESASGRPILDEHQYRYSAGEGFESVEPGEESEGTFRGAWLNAMGAGEFNDPEVRSAAKRLVRMAIDPLLEGRPLNSRMLFGGRARSSG